jgi:hypothetical protein
MGTREIAALSRTDLGSPKALSAAGVLDSVPASSASLSQARGGRRCGQSGLALGYGLINRRLSRDLTGASPATQFADLQGSTAARSIIENRPARYLVTCFAVRGSSAEFTYLNSTGPCP